MQKENKFIDLVEYIFKYCEKEYVNYAIVNNKCELKDLLLLRDIDILIERRNLNKFINNIIKYCFLNDLEIEKINYCSTWINIYILNPLNNSIIKIDLISEMRFVFTNIMPIKNCLKNRENFNGIYFLNHTDLQYYRNKRSKLINKFKLKNYSNGEKIKRTINYLKLCLTNPIETLVLLKIQIIHKIKVFLFKKRPLIITFLGPDGSGKSTIINGLNNKLKRLDYKTKVIYLFYGLIPRFRQSKNPKINKSPHSTIQRNKIFQIIRLFIWVLEPFLFLLQRFIKLFLFQRKDDFLIFDRYSYDIFCDRYRYGFSLVSQKVLQFLFLSLTPKPFCCVYLKCNYLIANARKPELSKNSYELVSKKYKDLSNMNPSNFKIEVSTDSKNIKNTSNFISKLLTRFEYVNL